MGYVIRFLLAAMVFVSSCTGAERVLVVTLGDSLSAGDGDSVENRGYPVRLERILRERGIEARVRNFAISGDTSSDLVAKQLEPALRELEAATDAKKVALVWIGSNDMFGFYNYTAHEDWCLDMGKEACKRSEMKTAVENMKKTVDALSEAGASVVIALLDDQTRRPVVADKKIRSEFFPGIGDRDVEDMSRQIGLYNEAVKAIASKKGASTVDFFKDSIFYDKNMLSEDGNHPNARGYDEIAKKWARAVMPIIQVR